MVPTTGEIPSTDVPPDPPVVTEAPAPPETAVVDEAASLNNGVWRMAGQGDVFTLDNTAVTGWYHPSGGHCMEFPPDAFPQDGLVVDITDDGAAAEELASRLIDEPTDFFTYEYHEVPESLATWSVEPSDSIGFDGELIVLVDGYTASAAEQAAGAIGAIGGTVVGAPTEGVWSNKKQWILPGDYVLYMSSQVWYDIDGNLLEIAGVAIDVEVDPNEALISVFTDEQQAQLPEFTPPAPGDIPESSLTEEEAVSVMELCFFEGCLTFTMSIADGDDELAAELCTRVFVLAVAGEGTGLPDAILDGTVDAGDALELYFDVVAAEL